nr:hypothetical protein Iba_chr14bCG2040 [Ipomoea batatas]
MTSHWRFTLNHLDMKIHMLSPEATLNTYTGPLLNNSRTTL